MGVTGRLKGGRNDTDWNEDCLDWRRGQLAEVLKGGVMERVRGDERLRADGERVRNSIFTYNTIYTSLTKAAMPRGYTDQRHLTRTLGRLIKTILHFILYNPPPI